MSFIAEKITKTYVGSQGFPAYKDKNEKCRHCRHDEFETFRGAGVTLIYCCKCQELHSGG
jgi:formamidopyrimidine-DNA glycosylase